MTTYKTSITGTTPFADYIFGVSGTNQLGIGGHAQSSAVQFNYNKASGGDDVGTFIVTQELLDADPYLENVGAVWKYHHFVTSGTLDVTQSAQPFRYVLVGGGRGGGFTHATGGQSGGIGGRVKGSDDLSLSLGAHTVTLGEGGTTAHTTGVMGADSTVAFEGSTILTTSGGASGKRDVYFTGRVGPWGVSGSGGPGGGCANSFGVHAGCGGLGQQDYGGAQGRCGCLPSACHECGGGCSGCASGHGVWHGHGGGGGAGGSCCNGGAGNGGRGGFIIAYRTAAMEARVMSDEMLNIEEPLPTMPVDPNAVEVDAAIDEAFDE